MNGGTNASCQANLAITPVNGQCGSANGGTFTSAPTTNLCSVGTASAVTGEVSHLATISLEYHLERHLRAMHVLEIS